MKRIVALLPVALLMGTAACRAPVATAEWSQTVAAPAPAQETHPGAQETPAHAQETPSPAVIRVLSFNIRHGRGRDGQIDLTRTAEAMKRAEPDIVALQEVDSGTNRSGGVDQLAELARQMGMHAEFGRAIYYEAGEYGVAILSRWPILSSENRPLPSSPDNEQRTALSVLLRVGDEGPVIRFTSTHLSQSRWVGDGLAQAAQLNHLLVTHDDVPSVLAGDFNARTDTDIMQTLQGVWTNAEVASTLTGFAVTSSQAAPGRGRGPRNDYVLFRPAGHWRVIESRVIDETAASDHRPVLAVLELVRTP